MTPEQMRELIRAEYADIHVEELTNGYSFWLGKKQLRPFSTRIVRACIVGTETKLKHAASSNRDNTDEEYSFAGDRDQFRAIFDSELTVVRANFSASLAVPQFQVGQIYSRTIDITGKYGGSPQSGIAPSLRSLAIFLFTGEAGHKYGYKDHEEAGVFSYCGEGQVGHMRFVRGNAAVRDHTKDGRALHLFKAEKSGQVYLGEFCYSSHEIQRGPDRDGAERDIIVFHLVRVELVGENDEPSDSEQRYDLTLAEAREKALNACLPRRGTSRTALKNVHERSLEVKRYVLLRAGESCESCAQPAPFQTRRGKPYLEPHHTTRLSDGGLDHPDHVGAICPNCHCEIHHGKNGQTKNEKLKVDIAQREALLSAQKPFAKSITGPRTS